VCGKLRPDGIHQLKILSESLVPDPDALPTPADPGGAARGRERWLDRAARGDDDDLAAAIRAVADDRSGGALLDSVLGNSPYLGQCLLADPAFACFLLADGPQAALVRVLAALDAATPPGAGGADIMAALRRAKRGVALLVGIADMAGAWPLETVTGTLSDFADRAIGISIAHLLHGAAAVGDLHLSDPADPERDSGLVILGMGKLGAHELNYSSDIDLIVLYDGERVTYTGKQSAQQLFVRMVRDLIRMLEERTGDGYVFRTDLRLRPDPGSTPPAISMLAAETYYESTGQNWERAAMIKARPVAGDLAAGARFLEFLRPFVWRRNLDFAAIQDIHSIKRQINAARGGANVAVAGHNIKLGRGGIREIEFFAQTQQLVWGGRDPSVRAPATCDALRALARAGRIDAAAPDRLIDAYRFLRRVEHRLQMVADRQTHDIPKTDDGIAALATFMGFADPGGFTEALLEQLHAVEGYYAELFEEAPDLGGPGSLVFTGAEDHPDTLETLGKLGFREPSHISAVIRGWHHGRFRATRSTRARELLTELMPALLEAFSRTVDPDGALMRFDDFLAGLPAGVQLFSLFHSNPRLLELLTEIMGSAPRLADTLRHHTILFDAVLTADFFQPPPDADMLAREMDAALEQARDFEDILTSLGRHANDRIFQIGVHMLRGHMDPEAAGAPLADVADTVLRTLLPAVTEELARQHGHIPAGAMAVVALGKLGGRELTVGSDLDLLFIYDNPAGAERTDGAKPLPPLQYFTRLGQRYLGALTAPTAEGRLYEVDMRLRPSGSTGPIASALEAFEQYQTGEAWTWEHMALTRARVVVAPEPLRTALEQVVTRVLTAPRDADRLLRDVADMRARMARERDAGATGGDIWDIKFLRGGLVDIEFIAQYLQLRHAHAHPHILDTNTTGALTRLAEAGLLDAGAAETLIGAMHLWRRLQGVLRLSVGEDFGEPDAPDGLRALLVRACEAEGFELLKGTIAETARRTHDIFLAVVEVPAVAAGWRAEKDAKP
jgi:glutamate-ammonia-ligase adenylyltransferase